MDGRVRKTNRTGSFPAFTSSFTENLENLTLKKALFRLIMHQKCIFVRGFAPDPTGEAYSTPPDPLVGFKGEGLGQGE